MKSNFVKQSLLGEVFSLSWKSSGSLTFDTDKSFQPGRTYGVVGDAAIPQASIVSYGAQRISAEALSSSLPDRAIGASSANDILLGSSAADQLKGLRGADTLIGGRGDDRLFGGQGKDDLRGGAGADRLFGGAGADKLTGGAGADLLRGGAGTDRLFGGDGADRIFADGADRSVKGGKGADQISLDLKAANAGPLRIDGGQGKDKLVLHIDYDLLTADEIAAFADDIAGFQSFLAAGASGVFRFTSFALNVRNIEQLILREKGDRSPVSSDDVGRVSENDAVPVDLLANDEQALRISRLNGEKVEIGETIIAEFGSVRLTNASVIEFTPSRAAQALSDGEVLNATFTYHSIAGNGRESSETLVTVRIDGVSDPVIALPALVADAPLSGFEGAEIVLSGVEVKLPGDPQAIIRVTLELTGGSVSFTADTDTSALTIIDGDGLDGRFIFEGTAAAITEALASSLSLRVLDPDKAKSLLIKATSTASGAEVDQVTVSVEPQVSTLLTPPSAFDDAFEVRAEGRLEGNLLNNDRANEGGALKLFDTTTPANGVLITADDGTFSYRPNAGFSGEDTFQYAVLEDGLLSNAATVVITVLANQAPTAKSDTAVTAEDTAITINVLSNDTDPEGDPLTVKEASALFGAVEIRSDGALTYTPPENFNGTDRISYVVSDGSLTDIGDVLVQVNAINDAPVAVGDVVAVDEDTVIVFDVLRNDVDADGDLLQITDVTSDEGEVIVTDEGLLRFAPDLNFNGPVAITYTISDGALADTAQVALTVNPINDAPVITDDFDLSFGREGVPNRFLIVEDEPRILDLLANDFDPDGDELFIVSATFDNVFPETSVTINDDGTLTILSTSEFQETLGLFYDVSDGTTTAFGNLALFTSPINDPPTGVSDSFPTAEDTILEVDAANGVLANDVDPDLGIGSGINPDFGRLGASVVSEPENGAVDLRSDGSFTYLPDQDFNGTDSFTYRPNDGLNSGEPTTVTIDVSAGNDAPVLLKCFIGVADFDNPFNCVVIGDEDQQREIPLDQLAFDPDGDPLQITNVQFISNPLSDPNPGVLEIVGGDRIIFAPTENFAGDAFFTYEITDGEFSVEGQGRIRVRGQNDAPIANPDSFTTTENTPLIVSASEGAGNLLDNDFDPDSAILSLEVLERPQHGEFLNNPFFEIGSFAYLPDPDFTGTETFTYRLFDGETFSSPATVTIEVTPAGDTETLVTDDYSTLEDQPLVISADLGVLANDIIPEGASVSATVVEGPENGLLTLSADGGFTYTPDDDFSGMDQFVYATSASEGGDTATVQLTVQAVADAPDLSVSVSPGSVLTSSSGSDTLVNLRADREQNEPQVNTLPDGRIVITWITQDHEDIGNSPRPAARIGQPQTDGVIEFGEEFVIGEPIGSSRAPSVLLLNNGNLLFAWGSNPIVAQVMQENPDGTRSFGPRINVPDVASQTNKLVDVAQLSGGDLFFVWETAIQAGEVLDGNDKGISGRIVSVEADGLTLNAQQQFLVNQNITGDQETPQIIALDGNRALITFASEDPSAGGATGGVAARIATKGASGQVALTDEFRINQSDLNELAPQVATMSDGRVVFVWGNGDVVSRIGEVNPDGTISLADEQIVNEQQFGAQSDVQVAQLSDSRLLFTWLNQTEDPEFRGSSFNIKARTGVVEDDGSITFEQEFFANEIRDSLQSEPMVAALDDGRAVVVWTTRSGPEVPEPFIGPQLEISARVIDVLSEPGFTVEVTASVSDEDGSEALETVFISGLPEQFSVLQNKQILQSNGVDPIEITGFSADAFDLLPSDGFSGTIDLIFTATSFEASNNAQNTSMQTVELEFTCSGSDVI